MKLRFLLGFSLCLSSLSEAQIDATHYPFVDVHIHPAIKPFNSRFLGSYNLWEAIDNSCDGKLSQLFVNGSKEVPRTSQCHFEGLVRGNVRLGFFSLTPLEKKSLNVNFMNEKKKGQGTMACVSGVHSDCLVEKDDVLNYYNDLVENIEYVLEGQNQSYTIDGKEYEYVMIKDAEQLREVMNDPHRLAMVFNIEGGHSLGMSLEPNDISATPDYEKFYLNNVDRIKGILPLREGGDYVLEYPFLSMNLNHFFWNGLSGHAKTFDFVQNLVFNQTKGLDEGMTALGEKVVKRMLDKSNGRRVLVDIKHMSWVSRQWYYDYLHQLHVQGDTVPIISSHSTVAGISASHQLWNKKDGKSKNKNAYLNLWSISLCDEDIQEIHLSKGIIGIMLDKYKLMGERATKEIDKTVQGSVERRKFYVKVIAANMLEAVEAVGKKSGWDIIALGSDFDGMITPFEIYQRSNDMPELARDLEAFFENPSDVFDLFTKEEVKEMMFGYSAKEIVRKVMYENGFNFAVHALQNVQHKPAK